MCSNPAGTRTRHGYANEIAAPDNGAALIIICKVVYLVSSPASKTN